MYRVLIHLVGDIHQPLHAVNRYSKSCPNGMDIRSIAIGDDGGNKFKVKFTDTINNLHFLWDSMVGLTIGNTAVNPLLSQILAGGGDKEERDGHNEGLPEEQFCGEA